MICTRCNTNRLDVRNILIPLINDEILRFTPFWKGMDTGLVFLKKKKADNQGKNYNIQFRRQCFGYPLQHLKIPDPDIMIPDPDTLQKVRKQILN